MEKSLSVITLNVNGLNSLIKRHSLVVGKKLKHTASGDCFRSKETNRFKGWKGYSMPVVTKNRPGGYISIRQNGFQVSVTDKKRHYILIKGSINKTIVNISAQNRASKYIKQIFTEFKEATIVAIHQVLNEQNLYTEYQ